MADENVHVVHSPTVLKVIEQFITSMRADVEIPDYAINRLEKLFYKSSVPRPDEINTALFESPQDTKA